MARVERYIALILGSGFLFLLGATLWDVWQKRPIVVDYPYAQHTVTRVGELPNWPGAPHTTFQTTDAPAVVHTFYRKQLTRRGWKVLGSNNPRTARFQHGRRILVIEVRPGQGQLTDVDLWLFTYTS